jgi:1-acyl-sn-glycerol-3-phosphate acyltransferase
MIDTDKFRKQLEESYTYSTPQNVECGLWFRMFGGLDIVYKSAVMGVIMHGGRMARHNEWNRDSWLNLSLDIWRGVENCGGRFEVSGCENLAGLNSPAVIVSNHMSLLETFAIPAIVLPFQHMTFVVKESLTTMPLFKDVMTGVQPISLSRTNPREDLKKFMNEGPKVLESGRSIVVFPQSTRSVTFKPDEFNSIGAKLAKRAGVPLVPLALKTDFHGMGRIVKDFGPVDRSKKVHFKFGSAMSVSGNAKAEHEACIDFIGSSLQSWGGEVGRRQLSGVAANG